MRNRGNACGRLAVRRLVLTLVAGLASAIGALPLVAQDSTDTENSLVMKAKQVSRATGRPILAVAGSNT